MKKVIFSYLVVILMISCSKNEKVIYNDEAFKSSIDSLNRLHKNEVESLKSSYILLIHSSIPDSVIDIPEKTKLAWFEYLVKQKNEFRKFNKFELSADAIKGRSIQNARSEMNEAIQKKKEIYDKKIKKTILKYFLENKKFNNLTLSTISNSDAATSREVLTYEYSYVFLGSNDSYHNAFLNVQINDCSMFEGGKMSDSFKQMLSVCRELNTNFVEIKKLLEERLANSKAEAEERYEEAVKPKKEIYNMAVANYYDEFLREIK